MTKRLRQVFFVFAAILAIQFAVPGFLAAAEPQKIMQAQAVLTVSEAKRLIAKGVKEMPIVKNALANIIDSERTTIRVTSR